LRYFVPGHEHVAGVSCGPTSLRDVLAAQGAPLTEAMVFGLGAGLGFYFLPSTSGLSRSFFGRRLELEVECCERLGLTLQDHRPGDAARAWDEVKAAALAGRLPIVVTDLRYLPYYATQSHFNGHMVTLAGFDEERGEVYLGDTDRPGLQTVTLAQLALARASEAAPVGAHHHQWLEVHGALQAPLGQVLAERVPEAIRANGRALLEDDTGIGGRSGLRAFVADLPTWPSLRDFARCAQEGFNAVEKRGTGGGFFRVLYAQFLDEAQALRPDLKLKAIAHECRELAWEWGELATAMKLAAKDGAWDGLPAFADRLAERELDLALSLSKV
jgi:hypothetical protein